MHGFNWFALVSEKVTGENIHVITGIFVALLLLAAVLYVRRELLQMEKTLVPSDKVTLANVFELIIENVLTLMEGVIGPTAKKHFPLIASIFIFIFTSNLLGLIPGFVPPTANINTNLACAVVVFIYFNYQGIKEQGLGNYFKHMMGPLWWLAPLILTIELFGLSIRPITLSLRLFCNINADHLVLGIFSNLSPLIVPIVFMILGLFVAFVQAFVFTLLSIIYLALATAHEEHH
ncbi:MAG: F0F1 ATP synthase subunit A [bacterium]